MARLALKDVLNLAVSGPQDAIGACSTLDSEKERIIRGDDEIVWSARSKCRHLRFSVLKIVVNIEFQTEATVTTRDTVECTDSGNANG